MILINLVLHSFHEAGHQEKILLLSVRINHFVVTERVSIDVVDFGEPYHARDKIRRFSNFIISKKCHLDYVIFPTRQSADDIKCNNPMAQLLRVADTNTAPGPGIHRTSTNTVGF